MSILRIALRFEFINRESQLPLPRPDCILLSLTVLVGLYFQYPGCPGFKQTIVDGGPIKEGLKVRIWFCLGQRDQPLRSWDGNAIARLDIATGAKK